MSGQRLLSNAQLDEMAAMRERGLSYAAIARHFGASIGMIGWQCLRVGAEPPKPGRLRPIPTEPVAVKRGRHVVRAFTLSEDRELLALEASGLGISEIARRLQRQPNSVRGRLMTLARREERCNA